MSDIGFPNKNKNQESKEPKEPNSATLGEVTQLQNKLRVKKIKTTSENGQALKLQ
jgi:hypothetical protein